jgi:hypothetical protein
VLQRWLFWPLFAAIMGFSIGGSFVWAIDHPNDQQHVSQSKPTTEGATDQEQPSKTFGKAVSIIWDRTWDDPVAFYTFVLAIFTALLAVVSATQIYFLIRADKTARISAEAAQATADAIQITERPYIFIWGMIGSAPAVVFSSSQGDTPPTTLREEAYFTYAVSNRGKLASVIENVSIACGYQYREMYPPLIGMGDHCLLQMPLISSEQDVKSIPFRKSWNEMHPIERFEGFRDGLIFRVAIKYRGPFTKGHETSQCWRYIGSLGGFAEVADEKYTYSR